MKFAGLLVANRGEVAIRVMRTAAEHAIRTVAVYAEDDATSLHTRRADEARPLRGAGPRAYLDGEQILRVAREAGCDALHPGYGFLAENAAFAARCAEVGIRFVGPRAELLERFGDKLAARALAERCGVAVLPGTRGATTLAEAQAFFASLGSGAGMMLKAVAGGGGRGTRAVRSADEIEPAYARCQSEARAAFGNGDVYAERLLERARHVEVQIAGDGSGAVVHLGERECTLQRRWQKLVELAPSPSLSAAQRERLHAAALRLATDVRYDGLGTFEFLLGPDAELVFLEANPRLQVEHTVTEAVTGLDLVALQLELASGRTLRELGLERAPERRGIALQLRVNLETLGADGAARPAAGTLTAYEPPSGPGVRVDGYGYAGYRASPSYDSLLAKLVCFAPSGELGDVIARSYRALCEFRIEGVPTNLPLLANLLRHPDFAANRVHTRFLEERIAELSAPADAHPRLWFDARPGARLAGVKVDAADPLAVLAHGKAGAPAAAVVRPVAPSGTVPVEAPMQGTIVAIETREGERVRAGAPLFVMEAMKMEHVIPAPVGGIVAQIGVAVGDAVYEGHALAYLEASEAEGDVARAEQALDLDAIRPDLADVQRRHAFTLDAARPDAVERRRRTGQRTARENVDDLCDPGSYIEYAPLVVAAQRRRRPLQELIERTPADGMLAGIGRVNGELFDDAHSRCIVMSYDYTVLAGTQGMQNHRKKDRLFELAERWRLPVVFLTEGGGGRPGDTDAIGGAGLDCMAFHYWGRLSGLVPLVGINSGRCFAGNAAILGCCDVVIATANSNIGMGGPAMIEGGGLGVFRPEEVGPMDVQVPNGVVDVAVADEAEAVRVAKQYLSYFQGPVERFECADQRRLRGLIPENRLRVYEVRDVIHALADTGSVLELRRHFGVGMVTALVRIEGRPLGVVANNPKHLGGAIDSEGADKAARFLQLCDAFDLPILFLCDTPGMMVGPEVEKTALVRHCSRLFVTGANLTVPFFTIVLRKGYGLGAQAMAGGSFKAPIFTVAWPTGEFGGMGLEGSVKLGFRNELAAITDPAERKRRYDEMVARAYEHGKALSTASFFEIDDVIDPADSRRWITSALRSVPPTPPREGKKRPNIDTW
jgi:acetyl/propionyl-CoA carboxylase alpha subunit